MKTAYRICAALLLIVVLATTVCAATGASSVKSFATVAADGSCQVTMTVTLHLEQPVEKLRFPVPAEATGITLNGSRVSVSKSGDAKRVDLGKLVKNVVGDVTFTINYSLHNVIHSTQAQTLEMQVPMLAGFEYPIEAMEFSVTMPGQIQVLPGFVSGYHQARIEEYLTYSVDGATVSGSTLKAMKDHETLSMTMAVTEEMFPRTIAQTEDYGFGYIAMAICGGAALLYWLVFMFNLPVWWRRSTEPPQGFTAGQMGCLIAGQGVDLSMTVLSWAQLGYILIQVERSGQVLLHKRMDMGNERSEAERRLFNKLFGKRNLVNTSGYGYAQLCLAAGEKPAGIGELMTRFNGSPVIFRALASGIGLFGGISLAVALAGGAALQVVLVVLLGAFGAYSGWHIQKAGAGILLWNLRKTTPALILCGIWLLLALAAGAFSVGLWMVLGLLTAGVLLAWGGRRTELGRQLLTQVLGLRRYFRTADKQQLRNLCETDPDYFFRLAPYAMALGADKAFAKSFGNYKLNGCPYLTSGMDAHMTALQWRKMMRDAVAAMDGRADRLPAEKLMQLIRRITKG